jgi:hypothetical protein
MNGLAAERDRLLRQAHLLFWRASDEFPLTINRRDTEGELGGLVWSPEFAGYLRDVGVCMCEGKCSCRRKSGNSYARRRLLRAFRMLRSISPEAYDACWLLAMHRIPYSEMEERLNLTRLRKGERPLTSEEIALFVISGFDLLAHVW